MTDNVRDPIMFVASIYAGDTARVFDLTRDDTDRFLSFEGRKLSPNNETRAEWMRV
jgi:hypothetical protein